VSEADPDFESKASAQTKHTVEISRRKPMTKEDAEKSMADLSGDKTKAAKYKIEIVYLQTRSKGKPSMCQVSAWESGKRFDGGGDQSMFWCLNSKNMEEGCGGLIPDHLVRHGVAFCPSCNRTVNQAMLPVARVGLFSEQNLAKELVKVFRGLGSNADLYLKFHRTDAHGMTRIRHEKIRSSEACVYPLNNILRDTVGGADLAKKFQDFLTA